MTELTERLRDAIKRASPLPWCWEQCGDKCDAPVIGVAWLADDPDCKAVAGLLRDFDAEGKEIDWYRETIAYEIQSQEGCSASANANLIVEAVNALPDLLAHIEALEAALEQWNCGSCGGSGIYLNRRYDKTRPTGEQLVSEEVTCTVCEGSGQNPIARTALHPRKDPADGVDS